MSERAALAGRVVDFPAKPEARPYLDAYSRPSGEPFGVLRQREQALARFAEAGFPGRKNESWRYLDLDALKENPLLPREGPLGPPSEALLSRLAEASLAESAARLVFCDGRLAPELSSLGALAQGVRLASTREAIRQSPERFRDAFAAPSESAPERSFSTLNAAFFRDGFVLDIAPGVVVERPIEIVHLVGSGEPASFHTRSLLALGEESRATLFESFIGDGRYWRNDVVEIALAKGAALSRFLLVEEGGEAVHTGETAVSLGAAARFHSAFFLFGGRTVREEAILECAGAGTHTVLNAAALLSGREEANIVTAVEHAAPQGATRELVKMVAAGRAHGAFQGRITVNPGAQQADAQQLSQNLILSPRAAIDTKPELEIFADDVKCSHGAAVGDIDEGALFYLRSRGIAPAEARRLVVEAFLRQILEGVEDAGIQAHLLARLARRLEKAEGLE